MSPNPIVLWQTWNKPRDCKHEVKKDALQFSYPVTAWNIY
jgi:hypothetical protein